MARGIKTGGRQKGTPNKNNPLKEYLRSHSMKYFEPKDNGLSEFDEDMKKLDATDRIHAELRMLEFHQARMKAVDMNMDVQSASPGLVEKLALLCENDKDKVT